MDDHSLMVKDKMRHCRHFSRKSALDMNCALGVDCKQFKLGELPCWGRSDQCDKRDCYTEAEAERQTVEYEQAIEVTLKVMENMSRLKKGEIDSMQCPKCGDDMAYSVSGYNGHVHAACGKCNIGVME